MRPNCEGEKKTSKALVATPPASDVVDGLFAIARAIGGTDFSTASFWEIAKALNRIAGLLEVKQQAGSGGPQRSDS